MKNTIMMASLILLTSNITNQLAYANTGAMSEQELYLLNGEVSEQELYLPDDEEYFEDEYEEVVDTVIDEPPVVVDTSVDEIVEVLPPLVVEPEPIFQPTTMIEEVVDTVIDEPPVVVDTSVDEIVEVLPPPVVEPELIFQPTTMIVASLQMVMRENNAEFLGYLFALPTLPAEAKIVSAEMVFVNSKNNQRIKYGYRLYAEKVKNPAPLSLDNLLSRRMENTTTSFSVYSDDNMQWAQGARWTIDVTTPIQELSYKQLLGNQLVLIAENYSSEREFFDYALNEHVVSLEIKIAGTHTINNNIEFTDNSSPSTVNAIPTVQDMPALKTALRDFGLSHMQINNDGSVELTLDAGTFLFRPDISSTSATQLLPGIQMRDSFINFVFVDEQGELRQQLLYPVAADADNLLKIIKMQPHTSQVKISEMGYVSFDLAGETYHGLLSYQLDTVTDKTGFYPIEEDINHDNVVDYQIVYDGGKRQFLISEKNLTIN